MSGAVLSNDQTGEFLLKRISEFIIALTDLLEAEGRSLRLWVVRLGWGIVLMAGAGILGLTSFGFLLWGIFQYLEWATGPAAAALLMAFIALALAGLLAWLTKWLTR